MIKDLRFLIKNNIRISVGLFAACFVLLEFSDSAVLIKLIRLLIPMLSSSFVKNSLVILGLLSLGLSICTFTFWIMKASAKRNARRVQAFRTIAQNWKWNYSKHSASSSKKHIDDFIANRMRGVPARFRGVCQSTENFLSAEINGDLILIFDCVFSTVDSQGKGLTSFETVCLVVSEKLELPYFQTRLEIWLGDNHVAGFLKRQSGTQDLDFPQRPEFSRKYIVDIAPSEASRVFTAPVFDFYERNQLYRTLGNGKMLVIINQQMDPVETNQLSSNLQLLRELYQLLKIN